MEAPILFFDGVCGLCNGFVDFVISRDRKGVFRFATLQGETAARILSRTQPGDASAESPGEWMRSVVLWQDGRAYRRSEAVLRVLAGLGGKWRLSVAGRLIPAPLRDLIYDVIARNRYRWFGKLGTCRLPKPEERARFLP